jgi:hypothetical protein
VTLAQPPTGEPDTERVVILWGLVMAQRQVRCLRGAMERHGASTVTRYAGGEPAFGADRAVSGLHLEVAALDDSTLLVAAGRRYRRWWRRFLAAGGASAAGARLYRVAVGQAPAGSALLFVVPRFPAPLPHLPVPPSVPRSFRGACLWVRPHDSGLRIESWVRVAGQGRAARWARKLPRRAARLARLLPAPQRPFLTRVGGRARGQALRLRLDVPPRRLPAFGRFVRRWLPW